MVTQTLEKNTGGMFFIYSLYLILMPIHLWSSGLPQVADFLMVFLMVLYFLQHDFVLYTIEDKKLVGIASAFVIHTFFVNIIWSIMLPTAELMIMPSLYHLYNLLVFVIIGSLALLYKEKIYYFTFYASFISIILQLITFVLEGGFSGSRATGTFNNPNQLGYYSLLIASLLIYTSSKIKVPAKWTIIGLIVGLMLVFSSLSKAAILAYIGLVVVFILSNHHEKIFKRKIFITLFLLTSTGYLLNRNNEWVQSSQLVQSVRDRIEDIGSASDDNLAGRGYNRIFNHPEYWYFGAGEGQYDRFEHNYEFHSTLGNVQVSYGLIGFVLFLVFLLLVLRQDRFKSAYIVFFILVYGLTHNGIRDSLFWILLGLIATSRVVQKERE